MLPSTLDMVPSPSTWNPRPSTLDKKIDSVSKYALRSPIVLFTDLSKMLGKGPYINLTIKII